VSIHLRHGFEENAVLLLLEQEGGSFRLDGSGMIQKKYLRKVEEFLTPQDFDPVKNDPNDPRWNNRFRQALRWLKDDGRVKYHRATRG
jgi:hypothetical protein